MTQSQDLTPLLAPLAAVQRLLAHFDNQGIIIGGVAASLLGKPRLTADVDAVLLLSIEEVKFHRNKVVTQARRKTW